MTEVYTEGIAFILEGATEKTFYLNILSYFSSLNSEGTFEKRISDVDGEIFYVWSDVDKKILIKLYVVGTVTQVVHSGKWFKSRCVQKQKIPWSVYLCYDTDSPKADVSKFFEGDWKRLREVLVKNHAKRIVDLAASADIEDVLLCDIEGVCKYLSIPVPAELKGRKGKAKMKALYRDCGATYHEGERAGAMIQTLNFNKIILDSPIGLERLKKHLLENEVD